MYEFEKKKLKKLIGEKVFPYLVAYEGFIAGGVITSLFCNREINDIDIYFRNKVDAGSFLRAIIDDNRWIVSHTNKATLFVCDTVKFQVVHFDYFNTAHDIFNKFDFTACMGAFDCKEDNFVFHEDFFKHNSQRLLKFNHNTSFPLVSAMRVQKYEQKGYQISKPEYIKILLACMNLEINNYDDLKEQMGGMYGINYDKLFNPEDKEEFNLSNVIEKIGDLCLEDDYFNMPESSIPDDIEDVFYKISGVKIKVFKHKNYYYRHEENTFERIHEDEALGKDFYEVVDISEIIKPGDKLYKFVNKVGEKYISYYDSTFEYKIGETVKCKPSGYSAGIYCGLFEKVKHFDYYYYSGSVLIELELEDIEDVISLVRFRLTKAKVLREVPKEEWENTKEESGFFDEMPY